MDTMIPVYFPFTYIPETVAKQIGRLLGRTIVYLPMPAGFPENMRQLQAEGFIEFRVPYPDDGDLLIRSCREFKSWGEQHYGDGASLKKVFTEGFYNQSFTAQIRSEILRHDKAVEASPDPVFAARLFLLMAQELDAQQHDLDRELALSNAAERELFARLDGREGTTEFCGENAPKRDDGTVMTAQRLSAWAYLFHKDPPDSFFLVTNSRASVEQMMESFPDIRQLSGITRVSCELSQVERKELSKYLMFLAQSPDAEIDAIPCPELKTPETADLIHLTLYLLPHAGPSEIFSEVSQAGNPGQVATRTPLNTIIALCET